MMQNQQHHKSKYLGPCPACGTEQEFDCNYWPPRDTGKQGLTKKNGKLHCITCGWMEGI